MKLICELAVIAVCYTFFALIDARPPGGGGCTFHSAFPFTLLANVFFRYCFFRDSRYILLIKISILFVAFFFCGYWRNMGGGEPKCKLCGGKRYGGGNGLI